MLSSYLSYIKSGYICSPANPVRLIPALKKLAKIYLPFTYNGCSGVVSISSVFVFILITELFPPNAKNFDLLP